jgi:hypothetical protein
LVSGGKTTFSGVRVVFVWPAEALVDSIGFDEVGVVEILGVAYVDWSCPSIAFKFV